MKNLGKIDWRGLQRYANPQAMKDLDRFLDAMPANVGYNALIAAGIAWIIAGCAVVFTAMQVDKVSSLRAALMEVEALQPPVPVIQYVSISKGALDPIAKKIGDTHQGITILTGDGEVTISAADTDYFRSFIGAIAFLQNSGKNWKTSIKSMCVGRDCAASKVSVVLKVEAVRIADPPARKKNDAAGAS